MTTYTWKINQLECTPAVGDKTNVVACVHWTCEGTDGVVTGHHHGVTGFMYKEGGSFTPFASLTQDQVLQWVFGALEKEADDAFESLDEEEKKSQTRMGGVERVQGFVADHIRHIARPVKSAVQSPWVA
jgi:hypothetical protein